MHDVSNTWHEKLAALYREHSGPLYALAVSVTRRRASAEDAVHEAFVRLCRRTTAPSDNPAEQTAYVYRAVKNAALDQWRRQKTQHQLKDRLADDQGLFEARVPERPDEPLDHDETKQALMQAIETLPEADQQAVLLRTYGGLSIDQIAAALEQSRTTVSSRYHRALKKLKEALSPPPPPEEEDAPRGGADLGDGADRQPQRKASAKPDASLRSKQRPLTSTEQQPFDRGPRALVGPA